MAALGLSLIAMSRGYSLVGVCGLLTASFIVEHGLMDTEAQRPAGHGVPKSQTRLSH